MIQIGTSIYLYGYHTSYRETTPVHMSNVQCLGTESRLTDCPHSSGVSVSGAALECHSSNSGACLHVYVYHPVQ